MIDARHSCRDEGCTPAGGEYDRNRWSHNLTPALVYCGPTAPFPAVQDAFCGPSAFLPTELPGVVALDVEPAPEPVYGRRGDDRKAVEVYPGPQVTSRDGVEPPKVGGIDRIRRTAQANDWTVETTYARGNPPHASLGTPLGLRDTVALRLNRAGVRAVVVYGRPAGAGKWTCDLAQIQRSNGFPVSVSVTEFERLLCES